MSQFYLQMLSINADIAPMFETWIEVPLDWRSRESDTGYTAYWNKEVGRGQLLPVPSPSEVASFYQVDGYYTHADAAEARNATLIERILFHIAWRLDRGRNLTPRWWSDILGRTQRKRVVEIGCGTGTNLDYIKSLGHETVGVEPDIAAAEAVKNHDMYIATAEALPEEIGVFDAAVFIHVLEHCVNPDEAVRAAKRHLAKGGICVAEVPNNECAGIEWFGNCWYFLDIPRHLTFFTKDSLTSLFESNGFRIERIEFRGYAQQFGSDWIDLQNAIASQFGRSRFSLWRYWFYFARTAYARDAKKYNSVRVVARLI